jgi:four helix bundle protein
MGHFRELTVYQKAIDLANEIFHCSKRFPADEKFGLTSQIRRSSRSVCSNIAEGYRKRRYPAHFITKITDADMENSETEVWLDFAASSGYINDSTRNQLFIKTEEIGKILNYIIRNPEKFR